MTSRTSRRGARSGSLREREPAHRARASRRACLAPQVVRSSAHHADGSIRGAHRTWPPGRGGGFCGHPASADRCIATRSCGAAVSSVGRRRGEHDSGGARAWAPCAGDHRRVVCAQGRTTTWSALHGNGGCHCGSQARSVRHSGTATFQASSGKWISPFSRTRVGSTRGTRGELTSRIH